MSGDGKGKAEGEGKSDFAWDAGTVRRMLSNPEATENAIEETVWKQINSLPLAQREDLLKAVAEGNGHKHPLFIRIFQSVHADLHRTKQ